MEKAREAGHPGPIDVAASRRASSPTTVGALTPQSSVFADGESNFDSGPEDEPLFTPSSSHFGADIPRDLPPSYEQAQAAAAFQNLQPRHPTPGDSANDLQVYRLSLGPESTATLPAYTQEKPEQSNPGTSRSQDSVDNILDKALAFTHIPQFGDTRNARLQRQIAIPSVIESLDDTPQFLRAYSNVLQRQGIRPAEFMAFIDSLNVLLDVHEDNLPSTFLARANSNYFVPRRLRVRLCTATELASTISPSFGRRTVTSADTMLPVPCPTSVALEIIQSLDPFIEQLSTDVPEPSPQAVALQAMKLGRGRSRSIGSDTTLQNDPPVAGPSSPREHLHHSNSQPQTWDEWGNALGQRTESWGSDIGRRAEAWGKLLGNKCETWGENFGRKMEALGDRVAAGPPPGLRAPPPPFNGCPGGTGRFPFPHQQGLWNQGPWGRGPWAQGPRTQGPWWHGRWGPQGFPPGLPGGLPGGPGSLQVPPLQVFRAEVPHIGRGRGGHLGRGGRGLGRHRDSSPSSSDSSSTEDEGYHSHHRRRGGRGRGGRGRRRGRHEHHGRRRDSSSSSSSSSDEDIFDTSSSESDSDPEEVYAHKIEKINSKANQETVKGKRPAQDVEADRQRGLAKAVRKRELKIQKHQYKAFLQANKRQIKAAAKSDRKSLKKAYRLQKKELRREWKAARRERHHHRSEDRRERRDFRRDRHDVRRDERRNAWEMRSAARDAERAERWAPPHLGRTVSETPVADGPVDNMKVWLLVENL